jgi:hypothetical protein
VVVVVVDASGAGIGLADCSVVVVLSVVVVTWSEPQAATRAVPARNATQVRTRMLDLIVMAQLHCKRHSRSDFRNGRGKRRSSSHERRARRSAGWA